MEAQGFKAFVQLLAIESQPDVLGIDALLILDLGLDFVNGVVCMGHHPDILATAHVLDCQLEVPLMEVGMLMQLLTVS